MVWYTVEKQQRLTEWQGKTVVYGVCVYRIGLCGLKRCLVVSDISTDKQFVRRLARDCTVGQLSPMQIYDVLENRLE